MPLIDNTFVSNWWFFKDNRFGIASPRNLIVESWTEDQTREVSPKMLIQGDIGPHAMSIGGYKWVTDISSPIILTRSQSESQSGLNNFNFSDNGDLATVFDIIIESFNTYKNPLSLSNFIFAYNNNNFNGANGFYILKSGTINIQSESIECTAKLYSDFRQIFEPLFPLTENQQPLFISRIAKWFDSFLYFADNDLTGLNKIYQIISGTITIDVTIKETFFIGQRYSGEQFIGNIPQFSIQSYTVNGDLNVMAAPDDFYLKINPEYPNYFTPNSGVIGLVVGGKSINFGEAFVKASVNRSLKSNDLSQTKINFHTFANINTQVNST